MENGNKLKSPQKKAHFTPKNKKRYLQLKLPAYKLFGIPKKTTNCPQINPEIPPKIIWGYKNLFLTEFYILPKYEKI